MSCLFPEIWFVVYVKTSQYPISETGNMYVCHLPVALLFPNDTQIAILEPLAVAVGISTTIPGAVCQIFYIHRCWTVSALSHEVVRPNAWLNSLFPVESQSVLLSIKCQFDGGDCGVGDSSCSFINDSSFVTISTQSQLSEQTCAAARAAGGNEKLTRTMMISSIISLTCGLFCDLFITVFSMSYITILFVLALNFPWACYYLVLAKTGCKEHDSLIRQLIKCSIGSAAGPIVVALLNVILINTANNDTWYIVANMGLSHVYGCSLLYTVNAREVIALRSTATMTLLQGFTHTPPLGFRFTTPGHVRHVNISRKLMLRLCRVTILSRTSRVTLDLRC